VRVKFRAVVRNGMLIGYAWYLHRLTDEYAATYIRRLTDECTGVCLSVETIFRDFGTEEYCPVLILDTEEYKITEESTFFSCRNHSSRNHLS
jgi:hypothetical protein